MNEVWVVGSAINYQVIEIRKIKLPCVNNWISFKLFIVTYKLFGQCNKKTTHSIINSVVSAAVATPFSYKKTPLVLFISF